MDVSVHLSWTQKICYAVGHVFNNLTAAMWFSYLIVYLQYILRFDSTSAGILLLIGQVADGVATPLIGLETSIPGRGAFCKKYGKRKLIHLIGTLCVLISFPFIFMKIPDFENASSFGLTIFLVPLVVTFQIGWAATQVSHLSLIPVITPNESERDFLNVLRFAVDIASDITTYVVVWMVFDLTATSSGDDHKINQDYAQKFTLIVLILISLGATFSLVFHVGVKENLPKAPPDVLLCKETADFPWTASCEEEMDSPEITLTWKDWLKETHFYQIGLLYTASRMFQNISSIFMPLYLQESLGAHEDFIAKIPLVMNVSGLVISCSLPKIFKFIKKKPTFMIGAFLGIGSCFWISVGEGYPFCNRDIYGVAVLMGSASSMLVICSLSFIHDFIGTSAETGAFVYGCVSFCDKIANGIAGIVIQHFHSVFCDDCDWFYKYVLSYGVGGAALVAVLILITLFSADLGKRRKFPEYLVPAYRAKSRDNGTITCYGSMDSRANETKPFSASKV